MDSDVDSSGSDSSVAEPRHAARAVASRPSRWMRPEFLFLPAFLVVGAIFIAWVPAGWNADEPAHAFRTAQIASGHPLPVIEKAPDGSTTVGGQVPNDLIALFALTRSDSGVVFKPSFKVDHLYTAAEERASHPPGTTFVDFRATSLYSPVAYLPDLAAFWVGDAVGLAPMTEVRLARILSLLVVGVAWTVAIRMVPRGKWVFTVFGLLPSVVSQSAALSADGMLLAVTSLFVAVWGRCVWRADPPSRRDYVVLTALAMLLGLCKIAYAPLVLLVVVVPLLHRTGSRLKSLLVGAAMLLIAWIPAVAWSLATRAANVSLNATADVHRQTVWIEQHPLGFAHVLYKTFLGVPSDGLALSVFGNFVWLSAAVPAAYALFGAASLAISRYVGDDREVPALGTGAATVVGVWSVAVALATGLVIALGIYLTFTPVGSSYVAGLTGRYFLPPLLVALVAVSGSRVTAQRQARWTITVTTAALLLGAILTLHHRLFA